MVGPTFHILVPLCRFFVKYAGASRERNSRVEKGNVIVRVRVRVEENERR